MKLKVSHCVCYGYLMHHYPVIASSGFSGRCSAESASCLALEEKCIISRTTHMFSDPMPQLTRHKIKAFSHLMLQWSRLRHKSNFGKGY